MRVSFGPFAFDPENRLLWRDGSEIALPPRVIGVLEALLDRAGQVVARQDLLDRVWEDAFVTDTSLAEAVSFLRQALGDDPQSPRYIQTVHRRGYRFLIAPTLVPAAPNPGQTEVKPGSDQGQTRVRPGSDWGQTGVRLGSDHLFCFFACAGVRRVATCRPHRGCRRRERPYRRRRRDRFGQRGGSRDAAGGSRTAGDRGRNR